MPNLRKMPARADLSRFGAIEDPGCLDCGEPDTVNHILSCQRGAHIRHELTGRDDDMESLFNNPGYLFTYLRRIGRAHIRAEHWPGPPEARRRRRKMPGEGTQDQRQYAPTGSKRVLSEPRIVPNEEDNEKPREKMGHQEMNTGENWHGSETSSTQLRMPIWGIIGGNLATGMEHIRRMDLQWATNSISRIFQWHASNSDE